MTRAIIFANGELRDIKLARDLLRSDDFLIGADGGTMHIFNMELVPDLVIGDMDSIPEPTLSRLISSEIEINLYPIDKNETDLELALEYAIESGYREIIIIAALGGRLDQTLSNIALLTDPHRTPAPSRHAEPVEAEAEGTLNTRIDDGVEEIFFCRDQVQVRGSSGDLVSLIPWGGEVTGIITENLKWPLYEETLFPYKSRGISNEMLAEDASIRIKSGLLLIVHRRQS